MNLDIKNKLEYLYPTIGITDEACVYIERMFEQYVDMDTDTLINLLPEKLKRYAPINCKTGNSNSDIITYLLYEVLESVVNNVISICTNTISVYHIWTNIYGDPELAQLFKEYMCKYCVSLLSLGAINYHKKNGRYTLTKKNVKNKLDRNNIKCDKYVYVLLNNIATITASKFCNTDLIANKINSVCRHIYLVNPNYVAAQDDTIPILQLENMLLDIIINKCRESGDSVVTCTIFHDIICSMKDDHFDYLFN